MCGRCGARIARCERPDCPRVQGEQDDFAASVRLMLVLLACGAILIAGTLLYAWHRGAPW